MMSKYITMINEIKEKCSSDWLTHSQREVFERIAGGLETHKLINIYGNPGSGKTFLGWVLQKALGFVYTNALSEIPDFAGVVLDDNFRVSRQDVRSLRPILMMKNIRRLILLTRIQVKDDVPVICLTLDKEDVIQACNNLYMHLNLQMLDKSSTEPNLHELIIRNIK